MLALLMALTLTAAPADDLAGVWATTPGKGLRQVLLISHDEKGTTRVLFNQMFLFEVVKKGEFYEPTAEAEKAAADFVEDLGGKLPRIYPLDGKTIGVGSDKPRFQRVAESDTALRALEAKTVFTSLQRKDGRAEIRGNVFLSITGTERGKVSCLWGVLLPPLGLVEKVIDPPPPTPKGAKLKPVQFAWSPLAEASPCDSPLPAAAKVDGMNGGVNMLVDGQGVPQALQVVGYMFGETFVRDGLSAALKKEVSEGGREEKGKAAE